MNFNYIPRDKKILEKVEALEQKILNAESKAHKCPRCKKGYYYWMDDGSDWPTQHWLECDKCGHCATVARDNMIQDVSFLLRDFEEYLSDLEFDFEHPNDWDVKERDFSPEAFNNAKIKTRDGSKVLVWEDEVDECYKLYIKELKEHIKKFKQYPLLKKYAK